MPLLGRPLALPDRPSRRASGLAVAQGRRPPPAATCGPAAAPGPTTRPMPRPDASRRRPESSPVLLV